jgi:hypothetical protein
MHVSTSPFTLAESASGKIKLPNMVLEDYTYVFAFGTMFALLEAFNNGASMS